MFWGWRKVQDLEGLVRAAKKKGVTLITVQAGLESPGGDDNPADPCEVPGEYRIFLVYSLGYKKRWKLYNEHIFTFFVDDEANFSCDECQQWSIKALMTVKARVDELSRQLPGVDIEFWYEDEPVTPELVKEMCLEAERLEVVADA